MDTGLLVIDMQNTFLKPDGASVRRGATIDRGSEVIAQTAAFVYEARVRRIPVVYTRHQYRADFMDMPEILRRRYPPDIQPATEGSWDAQIVEELTPAPGECVIDKNRYDAFLYTDAEVVLRSLGIRHLIIAGVITNLCVETTVRSAHQRDFSVTVAADCVGGADPDRHNWSLAAMVDFADVGTWRHAFSLPERDR